MHVLVRAGEVLVKRDYLSETPSALRLILPKSQTLSHGRGTLLLIRVDTLGHFGTPRHFLFRRMFPEI